MFSFDALVPPNDQWPLFDEIVMGSLSPFSSSSSSLTTPSPSAQLDPLPVLNALAAMPIPPSRTSPRNKDPNHIPRPRNAFMLFRSAFAAAKKITTNIEHDNRHITRIIANCWNRLSDAEKQVWRDKAAAEKAQHAERYPNYRFSPVGRAKKPKKRNVRRNGFEDVQRCEKLADLVMAGTCGRELEGVLSKIEQQPDTSERDVLVFSNDEKRRALLDMDSPFPDLESGDVPPFLNPLLPPAKIVPRPTDKNMSLAITTAHRVEPQVSCSPTSVSTLQDDFKSLFHSPCYPYYQLDRNNTPDSSPRSISPAHHQSTLTFVQGNQDGLAEPVQATDFAFFSWNQSDSFSYFH